MMIRPVPIAAGLLKDLAPQSLSLWAFVTKDWGDPDIPFPQLEVTLWTYKQELW